MKKLIGLIACIMLLGLSSVFAQSKEVTGAVTDLSGLGLPGVSVSIKGTTEGANTDIDGKWALTATSNDVIVISFIGMKTQEIKVGNKTVINVVLEEDRVTIEEVMVVAYGTIKKESFTGSAASIGADKLSKTPVISVDQALSGLSAGVQVSGGSGQPGSAPSIRIRGIGSINASQEPLYVIDGVAMTGGNMNESGSANLGALSALNPNDIATMTVLKDAAAAALYGSRAANGVVLITTKRGKTGATKFTFKAEYGFNDFAVKTAELASSKETFDYKVDGYKNYLMEYGGYTDEALALEDATEGISGAFPDYDPSRPASDYDWEDALFRTGSVKDIQFSAAGGNEKTKFFASIGYIKSEGVAVGSDFKRISGRINLDHKANDILSVGFSSSISYMDQNTVPSSSSYFSNPMYATRGFLNQLTPIKNKDGEYTALQGGTRPNLVKEQSLSTNTTTIWKNNEQAYLQVNILDGLTFRTTNSMELWQIYGHTYYSPISNTGASYNGLIDDSNKRRLKLLTSNILTYKTSIDEVHNFDALVGFEAEQLSDQTLQAKGKNLPNNTKDHLDVAAKPLAAVSNMDGDRMQSFLSRLNYNFDNKYYFSASYRTDASSRLGANNRWGHFYSVSGSWRLSQEDFVKDLTFINDWKIRSSFGSNGTLPSSWVGALGLYDYGFDYNGNPGAVYTQIENADLKWEKNNNFSIATEIKMFDFLSIELEYYHKKTTDLLLRVPASKTTGFNSRWGNVGAMTNQGVELAISSENIRTDDFSWTSSLVMSHSANTIDKLEGGDNVDTFPYILREGESFTSMYLRDWAGVNPENGHGTWYLLDKNEKRQDLDKDGKYDTTESTSKAGKRIVGSFDPLLEGSLSNSLSYKGLDLSFMFSFRLGGDAYSSGYGSLFDDGASLYRPVLKSNLDYWKQSGDKTDLPKNVFSNPQHTNYNSSRRLVDASYLRLKNVSLAYNLPSNIVKKMHLGGIRIYASGINLLTFSEMGEYDPEVTARGTAFGSYDFPSLRTYTFGVQVNF
jgi:TonB-linked SusC/RagA family outer membrane protein